MIRDGAQTSSGSPVDVEDLRVRVQHRLEEFLGRQRELLGAESPDLLPVVDAAQSLLAGGKRLRPAFCYWGWRGAGGAASDEAVAAATSLELFQASALVHDDLMDDSDTRRGQPAAHRRFAALHEASGWAGEPARFGGAAALLLGDVLLTWSDELLMGSGLPAARLMAGRAVFDPMRTQLMGGQYLDVLEQARRNTSVERARRVIRFKSAKYSVEHPLLLGGVLAGAPPALLAAYSAYGLPLGEAFQLRDDVLGVFGDPQQTGKPAGDDLREGKRTVLVTHAFATASPAQRALLEARLGDPALDAAGVEALREVIVATGALATVEKLVAELVDGSRAALVAAPLDPDARPVLRALVDAATLRVS